MKNFLLLLVTCWPLWSFGQAEFNNSSYDAIVQRMKSLEDRHPHLAKMVSMGQNDQGAHVLGLYLAKHGGGNQPKSHHLLLATHHGNERNPANLSLAFAQQLVNVFSDQENPHPSLEQRAFYVFPVLNISGYNKSLRYEQDALGRWHDSNRDYPDACAMSQPFKLRTTSLVNHFINTQNIISAVSVHGDIGTFTYPWGFYTDSPRTPDHEIYQQILSYATQANGYQTGTHKEVIYPAAGSFEDWAYHDHGIWVALFETAPNFNQQADVEALLRFFATVPTQRSLDHAHYGQCINWEIIRHSLDKSRP